MTPHDRFDVDSSAATSLFPIVVFLLRRTTVSYHRTLPSRAKFLLPCETALFVVRRQAEIIG